MAAHRQAAGDFDIDDTDIGIWASALLNYCPTHSTVPTRFKHQPLANMVHVLHEVGAFFKGTATRNFSDAIYYDTSWHSLGM